MSSLEEAPPPSISPAGRALEIALIFLLFCLYAGGASPDINEAHYLAKAKHYWNPAWCPHDLFLSSADAHLAFYWTCGWLTRFLTLPQVAWFGRIVTWLLLAWSWQRLSWTLVPRRYYALLSAALFVMPLDLAHLAGEWVVGGFEAKGFAYVLVLVALEALARNRWRWVWPLLGAAAALHVLVGGWSVVAALVAWAATRFSGQRKTSEEGAEEPFARPPSLANMLPSLAVGGLLALPGVIPAAALSWGVPGETVAEANRIYVFQRLPHHLLPEAIFAYRFQRHLALLAGWLALWWWTERSEWLGRLHRFVLGAVVIALAGGLIDLFTGPWPQVKAWLMRFYWFRLSDVMLPLGAAMALAALLERWRRSRPRLADATLVVALAALAIFFGHRTLYLVLDRRPGAETQTLPVSLRYREADWRAYGDWQDICNWIDEHTPADAVFLTPRRQQTFKWFAGRSEVVNWKDIPQDAPSIVEWERRFREAYVHPRGESLLFLTRAQLDRLAQRYGFRYVVVDWRMRPYDWNMLPIYMNDSYAVFRLPVPSSPAPPAP